jgi:hypothetical protein
MPKKTKKPKTPKSGSNNKNKDIVTGNWNTENGLEITFDVTSNNTSSKRYFAIADSFNGTYPGTYKCYADSNSNGIFDAGADKYTGTASVASWDGVPRYNGTFKAFGGTLESYSGGSTNSFSIPQNWFS